MRCVAQHQLLAGITIRRRTHLGIEVIMTYFILGPRSNWSLIPYLVDISEASVLHQRGSLIGNLEGLPNLLAGFDESSTPFSHDVIVPNSSIITGESNIHIQMLDPSSRGQMIIRMLVQSRPVGDTPHQAANMDEVEVVQGKSPRRFDVVYGEVAIWWDPGWLDGTEVYPRDFGFREGISKVHGPDTGAAPQIKHIERAIGLRRGIYRRKIEFVVKQERQHVMPDVECVVLLFVVWTPVLVFATAELVLLQKLDGFARSALWRRPRSALHMSCPIPRDV